MNEQYFAELEKELKERIKENLNFNDEQLRFMFSLMRGQFSTRGAMLYYISDRLDNLL